MTPSAMIGRRAVSPAVATVLLVAVTLVLAVSSAIFYAYAVDGHTGFEQLAIHTVAVAPVDHLHESTCAVLQGRGWNLSLTLKNVGAKDATVTRLSVNGRPLDVYANLAVSDGSLYVHTGGVAATLPSGSSHRFFLAIQQGDDAVGGVTFSPGSQLEIAVQSAAGNSYMQFVWLP